jgi:alpha/beta superfamily hydrolase
MSLPAATSAAATTLDELGRAWGYETLDGVPAEFARRVYHWVEMGGASSAELLEAFRAVPAGTMPGGEAWSDYWCKLGDSEWDAGHDRLDTLLRYEIGMFTLPFFAMQPHQQAAYERHTERYVELGATFEPELQVVRIAVEGKEVTGYLRVPPSDGRQRAVLLTGGADGWKAHRSLHATQEAFLRAGWVTLIVDLPGTGESPFALEPGCQRTLPPILEWLRAREEVDADRVAAHMRSFGGYFAVALAAELTRDALPAIVGVAPPIHHAFHSPPPFLRDRADWFKTLSLLDQQALHSNPEQPDLLIVQSLPDPLCPIEDTYLCMEHGIVMDTLIYAQDFHTAMLNGSEHLTFSIDWLRRRVDRDPLEGSPTLDAR